MTRFNACFASQSHQMSAAAHTAEASCCCRTAMMNTVISVLGAVLPASIFVASVAGIRLAASIMISIMIAIISLALVITGPRISILKEPPDLV